jgi:hypothetical protein
MTTLTALPGIEPQTYQRSVLHAESLTWLEKNCYVDIWIEVLHALGLEPRAAMPFVLAIDFLGDQWTFFKPAHDDLYELYGVDVQELTVWRPLIEHAQEHLSAGRVISTEADAFWLPDTAGTDYRHKHTKTTAVLNALDLEQRTLGYFHNAGYFELAGQDFDRTFRLGEPADPAFMPLFAELITFERKVNRPPDTLRAMSRGLVAKYLRRRPAANPVTRFAQRFEADLPMLRERGLDHYHAWAFGTTRQLGAAFELGSQMLDWLNDSGHANLAQASAEFKTISDICKALILKTARAVASGKPLDVGAACAPMAAAWENGMSALDTAAP